MLCSEVIAPATSSGPCTSWTAVDGTVRAVNSSRFGLGYRVGTSVHCNFVQRVAFNITFKQRLICCQDARMISTRNRRPENQLHPKTRCKIRIQRMSQNAPQDGSTKNVNSFEDGPVGEDGRQFIIPTTGVIISAPKVTAAAGAAQGMG